MTKKDNKKASKKSEIPEKLLKDLSFTESNKQLEELKTLIFNSKESKNNKIAEIKKAIANNEYKISSKKIAEKMVEDIVPTNTKTTKKVETEEMETELV